MSNRTRPAYEADRLAAWQLMETGRELRLARIRSGMRQADIGRALGTSTARVSLIERASVPGVAYRDLARFAGVVGMKLYLRAYPAGRRLLDAPQLLLFERLQRAAHPRWSLRTEVPVPREGDLRAADCIAEISGCRLLIELITRLADTRHNPAPRAPSSATCPPTDASWSWPTPEPTAVHSTKPMPPPLRPSPSAPATRSGPGARAGTRAMTASRLCDHPGRSRRFSLE